MSGTPPPPPSRWNDNAPLTHSTVGMSEMLKV
jgi:hypothetical protein